VPRRPPRVPWRDPVALVPRTFAWAWVGVVLVLIAARLLG
jgi:hypothetical protein